MTPQKGQAITAMKLTRQDLFTTESTLGLTNGFGANGTPDANSTPRARINGGGDAGGPPGGGGFGGGTGGTGGTRPTPNATQQALRAQFANRIPTPLMNALISLLQKKG